MFDRLTNSGKPRRMNSEDLRRFLLQCIEPKEGVEDPEPHRRVYHQKTRINVGKEGAKYRVDVLGWMVRSIWSRALGCYFKLMQGWSVCLPFVCVVTEGKEDGGGDWEKSGKHTEEVQSVPVGEGTPWPEGRRNCKDPLTCRPYNRRGKSLLLQ